VEPMHGFEILDVSHYSPTFGANPTWF
jgi:hypothetical protein